MANLQSTIYALCLERGSKPGFRLQQGIGYRSLSWAEWADRSLRLSSYLKRQGVGRGDRVLLVSENGPEWSMAALAAMNLGAVVVPVAAIASALEIENTFRSAVPKFCFYSLDLPTARELRELAEAASVPTIAWRLQQENPLAEWIAGEAPAAVEESAPDSATALLIYTSGTTGAPKGVPISHANVLANARSVIQVIDASERDRVVSVLPLSHMLEFTGGFVLPTLVGAEITYIKSLKPEDLLQALRDSKATVLIGVPLLFEVIARNLQGRLNALPGPLPKLLSHFQSLCRSFPGLGPWLFFPVHRALGGHIRFFVAGGSRLQPQTFEFFQSLGLLLLQGYGLTETSPVLTLASPANAAPDHVGRALPLVELGIFSEQGERLGVGSEGEIWAKGPNVFCGYLDPEHGKGAFAGEWFRTGDLGTLDEKGVLRITGRKKDIIVTSAGKNVYPEEIEGVVLASGYALEAAALGLKDSAGHEKITLVLVPDRAKFPGRSTEKLRQECAELALAACRALAEYKWPQRVEVRLEELPKTSTRKVKKHELRKQLEAGDRESALPAKQGHALRMDDPLESTIAQGIADICKVDPEKILLTDSLTKDLGLDSLTFVELVGQVEKHFSTKIEGVDFGQILTVRDLVRVLELAAGTQKRRKRGGKVYFSTFAPRDNKRVGWSAVRLPFQLAMRAFLRLRYRLEVEGLENLDNAGPLIFTPNHSSHADLLSVSCSLPLKMVDRTFAVAAKDYFFNRSWKALCSRIFVNALPFDRKGRVSESMQLCREALQEGDCLVIFPEGTRSPNGELQQFKTGVGQLLAGHSKARAVPVYIDGAAGIMPKGSWFPGPGRLKVKFGKPISFREISPQPEQMRQIADRLRAEVVDLSGGRLQ